MLLKKADIVVTAAAAIAAAVVVVTAEASVVISLHYTPNKLVPIMNTVPRRAPDATWPTHTEPRVTRNGRKASTRTWKQIQIQIQMRKLTPMMMKKKCPTSLLPWST